jgi:hypothetical protein
VSKSTRRAITAFVLSFGVLFGSVSLALAAWTGQLNALDSPNNGWIGADNPDNDTGTYAYDNARQDARLKEWDEPSHDWFRSDWMKWGADAETKLDVDNDKGIDFEFRIHEQDYYDYMNVANTNLPATGVDPDAWFEEPACPPNGCTEVDVEVQDTWRIEQLIEYWVEIKIDAQRNPIATRPDFVTEVEYCNGGFNDCFFDATGWMRKKLLIR